ncbi:MAG TPA: tetratricopeptide repeat protein [Candidatus Binatia bacterium]
MKPHFLSIACFLAALLFLSACEPEQIRRNDDILRRQEEELRQLREEKRRMETGERRTDAGREERRRDGDCSRAFRTFEQAQAARSPAEAAALYREGLDLCPDDEVAHYELGRILADMGRLQEARREFETALQINPNFQGARRELDLLNR